MTNYCYTGDTCQVCQHPVYSFAGGEYDREQICSNCHVIMSTIERVFRDTTTGEGAAETIGVLYWTHPYCEGDPLEFETSDSDVPVGDSSHTSATEGFALVSALDAWQESWAKNAKKPPAEAGGTREKVV